MRILITGGCGFVGSNMALGLLSGGHAIVALDNLKRRGSERNIATLTAAGVSFVHGDIRNPEDLLSAGPCDLVLECSAEPSVHAGYGGSPAYLVNTNLKGTLHCLEYARIHKAGVIFLSTSRVYPIAALRGLPLVDLDTRLDLTTPVGGGVSTRGIQRNFPLSGARSLYGCTKLASELCLTEYGSMYDIPCIVNRCGVIAGPGQMGKVDQGFFSLWLARHYWRGDLAYLGFGGKGHQVRDVLHVQDLLDLIQLQMNHLNEWKGRCWNVGGGRTNSVSLAELTRRCQEATGNAIPLSSRPETAAFDIPWYITDNTEVTRDTGWQPRRNLDTLLADTLCWLQDNEQDLKPFFVR